MEADESISVDLMRATLIGDSIEIESDGDDSVVLTLEEARALLDWLSKVLPPQPTEPGTGK